MMVGAIGIVMGLALYGPKLIKTVGSEITELDKIRAFCVAMAASITVIIASQTRSAGELHPYCRWRYFRCWIPA